jgi:hypothetical protein
MSRWYGEGVGLSAGRDRRGHGSILLGAGGGGGAVEVINAKGGEER